VKDSDLKPKQNRILATPATPEACAADLRPNDPTAANGQQAAAGAARNQLALSRAAARR
jgi:hypothetical protein